MEVTPQEFEEKLKATLDTLYDPNRGWVAKDDKITVCEGVYYDLSGRKRLFRRMHSTWTEYQDFVPHQFGISHVINELKLQGRSKEADNQLDNRNKVLEVDMGKVAP